MKKSLSLLMLTASLAFAQAGFTGGSEGLHQVNANTLGQWRVNVGAGGSLAVGSWALSRGGVFEADNGRGRYVGHSLNDMDFSHSGNLFVAVGVLDFVDVGASLPFYYDYAKSDKTGGSGNMWSSGFGDLDLFAKVGLPFASTGILRTAFLVDAYIPTGTESAGIRECLNLGHTLGHAIESCAGYGTYSHGACVAEGMRFAARVACSMADKLGVSRASLEELAAAQCDLLDSLGLAPLDCGISAEVLLVAMKHDKKTRGDGVRFVLARDIADWQLVTLADAEVLSALQEFLA